MIHVIFASLIFIDSDMYKLLSIGNGCGSLCFFFFLSPWVFYSKSVEWVDAFLIVFIVVHKMQIRVCIAFF